jgi:hypothetical protein
MITESQILSIVSGSIIGDYPSVIDVGDDNIFAIELFKKILDIDDEGTINSSLFNITTNSGNPDVIANYQLDLIAECDEYLDNLINIALPQAVRKIPFMLDPDSVPGISQADREVLIRERLRLTNIINSIANIPIIFSEFITE